MKVFRNTETTYGLVVTEATDSAELDCKRRALEKGDVGNIVLFSVLPHDIKSRLDWNEIEMAFSAFPRHGLIVEHVTPDQVKQIPKNITILK
ncbi:hypothetical protein Tamer19_12370 [Cupriavidus sp. TA19]|uniref:hypothetical protein n=1 Tax=unclassified Cupriavidus TaxID=2640874 RepID=UPI000E2E7C17|nr:MULTISPECIES: hypothetical protein [unclassified Cupriavidus]BDB30729.1 hypothetical protein CTP10_R81460 [Cupriavidus sp. P-10]GLC91829.1 hypothetical protein Tamer19_12370 [Cupriavidus sp. TA19]